MRKSRIRPDQTPGRTPQVQGEKEIKTLVSLLAACLLTLSTDARRIELWDYNRLFKEADLVVLTRAVETADTPERFKQLIGQRTKLSVIRVVQGSYTGNTLNVHHFRKDPKRLMQNGPLLITFKTKGIKIKSPTMNAMIPQPEYLVFLKKDSHGRFIPVTGQYDSRMSVRELFEPISEQLIAPE